jgi:two-component sensor histidine kinase
MSTGEGVFRWTGKPCLMKIATLRTRRKGADFVKRIWRHGFNPGSPSAFLFAVACVVAAALTRHLLGFIDPAITVFAPYFAAVLAATLIGGLPSGLVALVLGGLSAWWSFLPPTHTLFPIAPDEAGSLLIYCATGAIIIITAESHRRLLRRYYERENFNQLIISELQHRLRNKLTMVQAILGRDLRNNKDLWNEITGRLAAIGRTDELIFKSGGKGVEITEIVNNELRPYGIPSQIRLTGESLVLPPTLALSLTLILHELSTNAAKYGALSRALSRIDVNWTVEDAQVKLMWTESGGPAVHSPNHKGFGSELFQRALVPFHGKVEQEFASDGLKCKIVFALPRDRRATYGFRRRRLTSV